MKGRNKYIWLGVALFAMMACNVTRQTSVNKTSKGTIHSIDSLPATIIEPVIERKDSIVLSDTTSHVDWNDRNYFASDVLQKTLETMEMISAKERFLENPNLNHINFLEIKLVIDDFGNINYLDSDF